MSILLDQTYGRGGGIAGSGSGGGGGSTPPSGFPTITALPADQLVDAFGVNTHLAYHPGTLTEIYLNPGPYTSADAAVIDRLKYLGVRHIRETQAYGSSTLRSRLPTICAGAGVDVVLAGAPVPDSSGTYAGPTGAQAVAEATTYYGTHLAGMEGFNEPDHAVLPDGTTKWATWGPQTATFQQQLWAAGHSSFPILSPSMGGQQYSGTGWPGDLSAYCHTANLHIYAGGQVPTNNMAVHLSRYSQMDGSNRPVWVTEGGYHNAAHSTNTGNMPVPEDVAGVYLPRNLLELFIRGVDRFYRYELGDDQHETALTNLERHYGMFAWDAGASPTWRAKPEATAMRNLIGLFADPGAAFTPAPLAAQVTASGVFKQALFGRRNGAYLLALWRDVSVWTPAPGAGSAVTVTPFPVTVSLGATSQIKEFRPSSSAAAVATVNGTSRVVSLGAEVVVLQIS